MDDFEIRKSRKPQGRRKLLAERLAKLLAVTS